MNMGRFLSSVPQSDKRRIQKERQILGPYWRPKKAKESKCDRYTNCNCFLGGMVSKGLEIDLEDLKIGVQIKTF